MGAQNGGGGGGQRGTTGAATDYQVRELSNPNQVREFSYPNQVRKFSNPKQVREFSNPNQASVFLTVLCIVFKRIPMSWLNDHGQVWASPMTSHLIC